MSKQERYLVNTSSGIIHDLHHVKVLCGIQRISLHNQCYVDTLVAAQLIAEEMSNRWHWRDGHMHRGARCHHCREES